MPVVTLKTGIFPGRKGEPALRTSALQAVPDPSASSVRPTASLQRSADTPARSTALAHTSLQSQIISTYDSYTT